MESPHAKYSAKRIHHEGQCGDCGAGGLLCRPTGIRLPGPARRGNSSMARSAGTKSRPGGHQESARLGGSRFLDHAQRQVLFNRAFQSAGHRREHLEARNRRVGQEPDDSDPRRHQSAAAAGSHVYDRMLGQSRPPVFQRRHRQCALGRHAARPDPEGGRRPRQRHRGRLLGHRRRRDHAPPTTSSSSRISRAACRSPTPWIRKTSFATR